MEKPATLFVVGYADESDRAARRWLCWDLARSRADAITIRRDYEADGLIVVIEKARPA